LNLACAWHVATESIFALSGEFSTVYTVRNDKFLSVYSHLYNTRRRNNFQLSKLTYVVVRSHLSADRYRAAQSSAGRPAYLPLQQQIHGVTPRYVTLGCQ